SWLFAPAAARTAGGRPKLLGDIPPPCDGENESSCNNNNTGYAENPRRHAQPLRLRFLRRFGRAGIRRLDVAVLELQRAASSVAIRRSDLIAHGILTRLPVHIVINLDTQNSTICIGLPSEENLAIAGQCDAIKSLLRDTRECQGDFLDWLLDLRALLWRGVNHEVVRCRRTNAGPQHRTPRNECCYEARNPGPELVCVSKPQLHLHLPLMFGSDIDSRTIARLSSRELFSARAYPDPSPPQVERSRSLLGIFSQVVVATNHPPLDRGNPIQKRGRSLDRKSTRLNSSHV